MILLLVLPNLIKLVPRTETEVDPRSDPNGLLYRIFYWLPYFLVRVDDLPVNLASITISKLHVSVGLRESNEWSNLRRCGRISQSGFGSLKFVFINLSIAMVPLGSAWQGGWQVRESRKTMIKHANSKLHMQNFRSVIIL